jgi:solute carrier family 45 protein 1/2/4
MWMLLLVTAINWIAWFPFFLYNTDWMGHEVYGGKTGEDTYAAGVRAGTLGLGVQAGVLAIMSLAVERLSRFIGGAKRLWGIVNIILAIALAMTVAITKAAEHERHGTTGGTPSEVIKVAAFSFFAIIGIPLAVIFL